MSVYRQGSDARPNILICSGLDPSGGAGFVADVRVAHELGVRPCGVVTALTTQNTTGVTGYTVVDETALRDQLDFLLMDVEVAAVKIGMLGATRVAEQIGKALELTGAPLVWDPVLAPSRGVVSFFDGELDGPLAALAPHVTLITPNRKELSLLGDAEQLVARLGCAVFVKGGHGDEEDESVDVLVTKDAREVLRGPRVAAGEQVHGTGCMLSTAIAANLALGAELVEACREAKAYVARHIAAPARPGRGEAAVL